jgi:outer membrane receptor for ferrienterochelin and colicin
MQRLIFPVLIVLACFDSPALAQPPTGRVTGHIVEARTGAPLVAVLVQVLSTRQRALTDADGKFEIADVPVGTQTLVVSVVGFGLVRRDINVTADTAAELTIPVAEGASTYVEEVTVAASPFREAEPAVPSQSVLGSRELLALRGVMADDPFRAVQALPGVTTTDDFKGEFAVRGLGPQHIGIAVDGVDSPFLFHTVRALDDTGSLALINSDILDQAVLLSGPHPQRLGSHLGARLDFTTREGTRNRFAARALISGSAATGLFEGPIGSPKRGSWLVAARRSYIDWLLERIDPTVSGSFGFTDVQGGVAYDLTPRQHLNVTFIGGRSLLHENEETPSLNELDRASSRTAIANARWRFTLSPTAIVQQQLYVVRNTYRNTVPDGRAREEGWDRDVTWRGSIDWRPSAIHSFDVGVQAQSLRSRRLDRRFTSPTESVTLLDETVTTAAGAGYVSYRWSPKPAIVIGPGARVEFGTKVSPWLLAEYQMRSGTRVRAGAAVQHQRPTVDQNLFAPEGTTLRPEEAATFEVGVDQQFRGTWRASVNVYRRQDRDRLHLQNADFRIANNVVIRPGERFYANALKGTSTGVDLIVERRSVNGWTGWISYSFGKSTLTDTVTGETYPADYDQTHTVNIYSGYRWSARTSVSARFRYGSNFPFTAYVEPRGDDVWVLSSERNQARLPDYARLDLRADRAFTYRKRRLTLFLEVINVLNHDNYRAQSGSLDLLTREVRGITERVFPFLPSAGVLIEF